MSKQYVLQGSDPYVLEALSKCKAPVSIETLLDVADPRHTRGLTTDTLAELMAIMVANGHAQTTHDGRHYFYSLTEHGCAHLIALEVQGTMRDVRSHVPIRAAICNRREPEPVATALISIAEDELDDWWETLDAEMKADVFADFCLGQYVKPSRIRDEVAHGVPLAGTLGERDAQLFPRAAAPTETRNAPAPQTPLVAHICDYCGNSITAGITASVEGDISSGEMAFTRFVCPKAACQLKWDADLDYRAQSRRNGEAR